MNNTILMGRIATDLELKTTQQGTSVISFTLAVPRRMKKDTTDFIRCIAWRQTAEFISKFFSKGRMIAVDGEIQTRMWESQDGRKQYATEVICNNVFFTGEKATEAPAEYNGPSFNTPASDNFTAPINDTEWADVGHDDNLPF